MEQMGAALITSGYRPEPFQYGPDRKLRVCGALPACRIGILTKERGELPFERPLGKDFVDNHSTKGKSGLIRELIAKGLSVRQAEKAVNAVFDCMSRAVRRGETVEIPGGTIQAKIMNGESAAGIATVPGCPHPRDHCQNCQLPGTAAGGEVQAG